ncbi:hypothetical protein RQP46_009269 [Phenoliferia psychrophenolica]
MLWWCLAAVATLLAHDAGAAPSPFAINLSPSPLAINLNPVVTLPYGKYQGSVTNGVVSYLGIPYAQPPTGDLRLRRPLPIEDGTFGDTVNNATNWGNYCVQMPVYAGEAFGESGTADEIPEGESEDCLNLNVVAPAVTTKLLPVVIYGGGFEFGSTQLYNATPMVTRSISSGKPIVFMSMQYRLNALGFLASSEVQDAKVGNLGLWDKKASFQWVQDHIEKFGGDKNQVTISGGQLPTDNFLHGQKWFDSLSSTLGCSGSDDPLGCLRTVDAAAFRSAIVRLPGAFTYQQLALPFFPRTDGVFLTESAQKSVTEGRYAKVPLLSTGCEDEGTQFSFYANNVTTDQDWMDYIHKMYLPSASQAEIITLSNLYPQDPTQGSPYDTGYSFSVTPQFKRLASFSGDFYFESTRRLLLSYASKTQNTWSYRFSRGKGNPYIGAYHSSDIALYFGDQLTLPNAEWQGVDYLTNFASTMDPNSVINGTEPTLAYWPKYTSEGKEQLSFVDRPLGGKNGLLVTVDNFREEAMAFVIQLFLKHPM